MNVKLTQNELKKQRDALRQYERYLPTLQLKKQQLQREISHQRGLLEERTRSFEEKMRGAADWAGLLVEFPQIQTWIVPESIQTTRTNIAGVDLKIFDRATFREVDYDLFLTPLWVDTGVERLQELVILREERALLEEGISILKQELLVTTQRVNLFEKVKIPEAREAIRRIKIHIGDQMTNAVGRGKMVKRKIERAAIEEGVA
jgi:H(+)-transporting ATP synthase, vacuolar type, subunit D